MRASESLATSFLSNRRKDDGKTGKGLMAISEKRFGTKLVASISYFRLEDFANSSEEAAAANDFFLCVLPKWLELKREEDGSSLSSHRERNASSDGSGMSGWIVETVFSNEAGVMESRRSAIESAARAYVADSSLAGLSGEGLEALMSKTELDEKMREIAAAERRKAKI